jgi:hypothetical protein
MSAHSLRPLLGAVIVTALALVSGSPARADFPGAHPYYLDAIADLRVAKFILSRPSGGSYAMAHEQAGIAEIDKALAEIKAAAVDDGKDLRAAPKGVDIPPDFSGRLHRTVEILHKVEKDVNREEDDPYVRGLRDRSLVHVRAALRETEAAIFDITHQ